MNSRRRLRADDGSVLVTGLLLLFALLLVIGASVDLGRSFILHRQLAALADQAALAGAQALDTEARRAGTLALNPASARNEADAVLRLGTSSSYGIEADTGSIRVHIQRELPTILLALVGLRTLTVAANAVARPREP